MPLDRRQKEAVSALVEGKTVEEASKEVGRTTRTILQWAEEPEFQAAMIHGIRAVALSTLTKSLKTGEDVKAGQVALSILRCLGVGDSARKPPADEDPDDEDETDMSEFSKEQLERLGVEDEEVPQRSPRRR